MQGHRTICKALGKTETIHSVFSDQDKIKLSITYRVISGRAPGIWKLSKRFYLKKMTSSLHIFIAYVIVLHMEFSYKYALYIENTFSMCSQISPSASSCSHHSPRCLCRYCHVLQKCMVICTYMKSSNLSWEKSNDICPSETGLICSYDDLAFIFLQMMYLLLCLKMPLCIHFTISLSILLLLDDHV